MYLLSIYANESDASPLEVVLHDVQHGGPLRNYHTEMAQESRIIII